MIARLKHHASLERTLSAIEWTTVSSGLRSNRRIGERPITPITDAEYIDGRERHV
jgi:hypothetical protein